MNFLKDEGEIMKITCEKRLLWLRLPGLKKRKCVWTQAPLRFKTNAFTFSFKRTCVLDETSLCFS